MSTMKYYFDLYSKDDVFLLACVFEVFRKESTPAYSWDAMLRFKHVDLKLISDIEKYRLIENKIRGGVFMIFKGYDEAKNKFLKSYNADKPTSYIIYFDANNFATYPN